jgi:hypothetical protein
VARIVVVSHNLGFMVSPPACSTFPLFVRGRFALGVHHVGGH